MDRAYSTNGEKRNARRILVGKPEGKRPLGRPRRKWVDNIKMDLREIGWGGMDWIDLAQDGAQWRALNLRIPQIAGKICFSPNASALCKDSGAAFLPSATHNCSVA
jgi:hypothetical protein